MQSSSTTISKSALLSAKASFDSDDTKVAGLTTMEEAKLYRSLPVKSPKHVSDVKEEDEDSTTASSGGEYDGMMTTGSADAGVKPRTFPSGQLARKTSDNWFLAQCWGLAAGILLAVGFELVACAAAAMAVFLCFSRKEPFLLCRAPQPVNAAMSAKKTLRTQQVKRVPTQRATVAPPQKTIIAPKPPTRSAYFGGAAPAYAKPASTSMGPRCMSAPTNVNVTGSTAELQKLMATPSVPQTQRQASWKSTAAAKPQSPKVTVAPKPQPIAVPVVYTPSGFRRELVSILKELAQHRNAAVSVGQVRLQNVPQANQSAEFSDILTRAMEERNGPVRRTYVAFAAGLAAGGEGSAFDVAECAKGTGVFFAEVYEELLAEVSRLEKIVECELVPTLKAVFSAEAMRTVLPATMI